ncbi:MULTISPECIES: DUF7118 family protein [Halococcus]|uniref:Uncharacterized protein n=1 Tax=Halococcus salifodinae DSM 8989 TaxID=1227456 RepID=M0N5T2_9EURY|nr:MULTISPECIES: hypothetical protein [Halococcus]EMA52474.1 hypothetical protein C450_10263 [Halococcus salifodinae DSM 8989]
MSESVAESDDVVADLEAAHTAYEEVVDRIADHGESDVRAVAAAHDRATTLLDRYDGRATGTGDFEAFIEFEEAYESFVDDLTDDLPHRDAFETTAERFDKRRLSESDFAAARETLAPAGDLAGLLVERDTRATAYRDARRAVDDRLAELDDRLDELERIRKLGDADLDAPVADLRDPIAAYDERVADAFATFEREASAREFLDLIATTERYPLVAFPSPPTELREYVEATSVGAEPVPTLIEYADYSRSKLSHYVDDPQELKRHVAVHRSYLERLDSDPLEIGWPPPSADELRWQARELVSVVGRFASEEAVASLREVRALASEDRYERLRNAARARADLTADEREKLSSGAIERERDRVRTERDRLVAALDEHQPL